MYHQASPNSILNARGDDIRRAVVSKSIEWGESGRLPPPINFETLSPEAAVETLFKLTNENTELRERIDLSSPYVDYSYQRNSQPSTINQTGNTSYLKQLDKEEFDEWLATRLRPTSVKPEPPPVVEKSSKEIVNTKPALPSNYVHKIPSPKKNSHQQQRPAAEEVEEPPLELTIAGINVEPYIIPPLIPKYQLPDLLNYHTAEAGAPSLTWSPSLKSGYLQLRNKNQTVDGRLGRGFAVCEQGFAIGTSEWRFVFETEGAGWLKCGLADKELSAFKVSDTWGFSRYRFPNHGSIWLCRPIRADKKCVIRMLVDLESEVSSVVLFINNEPYFRIVGVPRGRNQAIYPAVQIDSCVVTGLFPIGTNAWRSLNIAAQQNAKPVNVMDVQATGAVTHKHKFRDERHQKMRQTVGNSHAGLVGL